VEVEQVQVQVHFLMVNLEDQVEVEILMELQEVQ
tara:strand:+ start:79 stop:180 length:102 start_codon:yes stop_codon:yes gene_type:complete